MSERPNAHMIFLPTELYIGLIKKMAAYEIGKSAAILDSLNEDLHNQGFIDDETYVKFREQYRKKLLNVVREKEKPTVIERPDRKILQLQKTLVMITERWEEVPEKSKRFYIEKAKEFKDSIPEAREILRKAGILNE